jgi:hypothetical protein
VDTEIRSPREGDAVKTLAFVIALCILVVAIVGILAPSSIVWLAQRALAPAALYAAAGIRLALAIVLISAAPASRAPRTLRALAGILLVAAIATPIVGVERAPAIIEWWTQLGLGVVRLTGILLLAFGGFVAYACAPPRRTA